MRALHGAAEDTQQVGGGLGQEGIAVGTRIGGRQQGPDGAHRGVRQRQPAVFERRLHGEEAGLAVGLQGGADLRDQLYASVGDIWFMGIGVRGVRFEVLLGQPLCRVQHGGKRRAVEVGRKPVIQREPIEQEKIEQRSGQRHVPILQQL